MQNRILSINKHHEENKVVTEGLPVYDIWDGTWWAKWAEKMLKGERTTEMWREYTQKQKGGNRNWCSEKGGGWCDSQPEKWAESRSQGLGGHLWGLNFVFSIGGHRQMVLSSKSYMIWLICWKYYFSCCLQKVLQEVRNGTTETN